MTPAKAALTALTRRITDAHDTPLDVWTVDERPVHIARQPLPPAARTLALADTAEWVLAPTGLCHLPLLQDAARGPRPLWCGQVSAPDAGWARIGILHGRVLREHLLTCADCKRNHHREYPR